MIALATDDTTMRQLLPLGQNPMPSSPFLYPSGYSNISTFLSSRSLEVISRPRCAFNTMPHEPEYASQHLLPKDRAQHHMLFLANDDTLKQFYYEIYIHAADPESLPHGAGRSQGLHSTWRLSDDLCASDSKFHLFR